MLGGNGFARKHAARNLTRRHRPQPHFAAGEANDSSTT